MVFVTRSYHSPDPIENLRIRITMRRVMTGGASGFSATAARLGGELEGGGDGSGRGSVAEDPKGGKDGSAASDGRRESGGGDGAAGGSAEGDAGADSAAAGGGADGGRADAISRDRGADGDGIVRGADASAPIAVRGRPAGRASGASREEERLLRRRDALRPKLLEKVVAWQEKHFGPADVARLGRGSGERGAGIGGPSAVLERDYRSTIAARLRMEPGWNGDVVHTAVHNDGYVDPFEFHERYTTSEFELPSTLTEITLDPEAQMRRLRQGVDASGGSVASRRRGGGGSDGASSGGGGGGGGGGILAPGKSHLAHELASHQFFHVVASFEPLVDPHAAEAAGLDDADLPWLGHAHPLCVVRATSNHTFDMKPGFNTKDTPHVLILEDGTRYEYVLENAAGPGAAAATEGAAGAGGSGGGGGSSGGVAAAAAAAASRTAGNKEGRALELRKSLVGTEFTPPPYRPGLMRYYILGDITRACDFDEADLYIEYRLVLPRGWHLETPNTALEGVTQISRGTCRSRDELVMTSHFAHPIEYALYYEHPDDSKDADALHLWPTLYLKVSAWHTWDRNTIQGYTFASIPQTRGHHELSLPCWRPAGTLRSKAREFFVGGSRDLADIDYAAVPLDHSRDRIINKYGFVTEARGSVELRLNVVTQKHVARTEEEALRRRARNKAANRPRAGVPLAPRAGSAAGGGAGAAGSGGGVGAAGSGGGVGLAGPRRGVSASSYVEELRATYGLPSAIGPTSTSGDGGAPGIARIHSSGWENMHRPSSVTPRISSRARLATPQRTPSAAALAARARSGRSLASPSPSARTGGDPGLSAGGAGAGQGSLTSSRRGPPLTPSERKERLERARSLRSAHSSTGSSSRLNSSKKDA